MVPFRSASDVQERLLLMAAPGVYPWAASGLVRIFPLQVDMPVLYLAAENAKYFLN